MELKYNPNTSMLFLISSIILASTSAFIISSPGLRRYLPNQPCVFEWKVNRSFSSFLFLNKSGSINTSRILTHNETSAIHLVIIYPQLYDAGNYTLVVTFDGDSLPSVDNNACLYVYGAPTTVNISLTEGTYPVAEGGALTFTCSATSNSQPAQYRQNLIYYFHMGIYNNFLQRRADGTVVENDRYTMIDDRTLRINPVSSTDQSWVHCHACEISCSIYSAVGDDLNIRVSTSQNGKLLVTDVTPRGKKYHASVGESVTLYVYYAAVPSYDSIVWSFSSSESGSFNPLTWSVSTGISTTYAVLSFTLSSPNQYGFYKCTINNALGSVSATLQILQPAPPEPPMLAQLFITQSSINVQWNSGWDSGLQQYFRLQLYNRKLNVTTSQVDRVQTSYNYSSSYSNSFSHYTYPTYHYYYYSVNYDSSYSIYYSYANYFNYTYVVALTTGVYPDTDYEVRLWSVNELGSSSAVRLPASTPARSKIKLVVSQDSISILGDTSTINFFIEGGTASNLTIQCYELNSMKFVESTFNLTTATRQVNMTVPVGTKYRFNFRLFNNFDVLDYQTIQIPTEASASSTTTTTCEPSSSLIIIIILAALLGVAVLFGVAELVWICCHRHRHITNANDSSTAELSKFPTLSESKSSSRARNNYTEESFYTSLDDQQEQEGPQEVYQNIQPSQNDTITPKRKAMPLPTSGRY